MRQKIGANRPPRMRRVRHSAARTGQQSGGQEFTFARAHGIRIRRSGYASKKLAFCDHPSRYCCVGYVCILLPAAGGGLLMFVAPIRLRSEAATSGEKRVTLVPPNRAGVRFPIDSGLVICSRTAPISVTSMMPCKAGTSWCRLIPTTNRETERNRGYKMGNFPLQTILFSAVRPPGNPGKDAAGADFP